VSLFDTGIRPAIDAFLLEEAKKVRDYGDYWSASSAGYCMRKNILERLKVPYVTEDARKQRVFTAGHIFHQWVQEITKKTGLSIAQELELQDEELMVRGHTDDLVLIQVHSAFDPPENAPSQQIPYEGEAHLILYDYKTQNSRAFSYKRPEMSHYHKMQLGTYMYMLRNGGWAVADSSGVKGMVASLQDGTLIPTTKLTEARILKISKDDLRMSEEQLLWTPALEKEVYQYWSTLNGYWSAKTLPRCTCADYEGGFMAKEAYNPYFYKGEPCSEAWYKEWKLSKEEENASASKA